MDSETLKKVTVNALEDLKAVDIEVLDVRQMTSITDFMIVASAGSGRQIKALADHVVEKVKENGCKPLGVEGERDGQWALVDVGDVVVHIMLPRVRDFYQLEKLWRIEESAVTSADAGT